MYLRYATLRGTLNFRHSLQFYTLQFTPIIRVNQAKIHKKPTYLNNLIQNYSNKTVQHNRPWLILIPNGNQR